MKKAQASSSQQPAEQPNSRKEQQQQEQFIASTSFTGAREGYMFTKGAVCVGCTFGNR